MQPNYLCKNIYRTCCCATNCTEQQLVFTFLFPGYRLSCVGWAHEDTLLQRLLNTCNLGTQAQVRGPNIQQRQKLNTSCLPDYTSSAVAEGSWIFFKFKEKQIVRTERDRNQFQSVIATERSLCKPHWSLFLYICISLHDVVVIESANHIKIKLQFELGSNEK